MVRRRKLRTGRSSSALGQVDREHPLGTRGKIIVRLRPMLEDELSNGEKLCVMPTARGGEVKLKLSREHGVEHGGSSEEHWGARGGKHGDELTEYQLDRAIGPSSGNAEVYSTAAARLVEWACAGGNALLLVAGTPGSGRSHTLFGGGASNPNAPGEAEQGLLPRALAELERRWRGGESGSPLPPCSSPQRSLAASTFVVRLCVAEVSCGIVETTTDLLRDAVVDAKQVSSSPTRWRFSAKGMLAVIASPPRCADGSGGGGGGGGRRRKSAGRGSHGAAANLLTSQVLVGVTEVTAGGVAEAVAFVRQGAQKRRKECHLVIAAKIVPGDGQRASQTGGAEKTATGEMVFVEIGDGSPGNLPQLLRTALAHLKIGDSPAIPKAQPRTARPSALTGTSTAPARPVSSGGKHSGDALWTLLGSFAEKSVAAPDEFSAQGSPSRSRRAGGLGKPRGSSGGVAAVSESGAGAIETAAAIAVNPLLVSVVATLRTGSGSYLKSKGVLEALAKSTRTRSISWKSRPLKRMLVSIPSFTWRSSNATPAATNTSAAAPSAPPVPSSEASSASPVSFSTFSSANGVALDALDPESARSLSESKPSVSTKPLTPPPPPRTAATTRTVAATTAPAAAAAATAAAVVSSPLKTHETVDVSAAAPTAGGGEAYPVSAATGPSTSTRSSVKSVIGGARQVFGIGRKPATTDSNGSSRLIRGQGKRRSLSQEKKPVTAAANGIGASRAAAAAENGDRPSQDRRTNYRGQSKPFRGDHAHSDGAPAQGERRSLSQEKKPVTAAANGIGASRAAAAAENGDRPSQDRRTNYRGQSKPFRGDRAHSDGAPAALRSSEEGLPNGRRSSGEGLPNNRRLSGEGLPNSRRSSGEGLPNNRRLSGEGMPNSRRSSGEGLPNNGGVSFPLGGQRQSTVKEPTRKAYGRRRTSPPWDGQPRDLLELTPQQLVDRVMQAEKAARHWKAQHARVERKLVAFMTAKSRPVATSPSKTDGVSTNSTKAEEDSSKLRGSKVAEGLATTRAAPRTRSRDLRCRATSAPSDRTTIAERGEYMEPSGGDDSRSDVDGTGARGACGHCGNRWNSPDEAAKQGTRRGLHLRVGSSGSGGEIDRQVDEETAALHRSETAHASEEEGTVLGAADAGGLSSPRHLTFEQRRAVFCSYDFVPTPPALRSSTAGTPAPSTGSPQLMGSLTPRLTSFSSAAEDASRHKPSTDPPQHTGLGAPRMSSFSSTAVEAARHNLQRKYPVRRGVSASARTLAAAAPSTPIPKSSSFSIGGNRWNGAKRKSFPRKNENAFATAEPKAHHAQANTTTSALAGRSANAVLESVSSPPDGSPNGRPPSGSSRLRSRTAPSSHQSLVPSTPRHRRAGAPPPAPSPTGTEDATPGRGSGSATWSTRSPSLSSPPSFPRPKAHNRAKGTGDSAVPEPVEASEESHCKRSSNVWYGIYEGHQQSGSRRDRDSGATNKPVPPGGRGFRGSRTSTRSTQRGQPQRADKRGDGGGGVGGDDEPRRDSIVASLAMASPQCLSPSGSPPLSPAFVRALSSSSSSMASVLLDATATSRLPPTVPGTPGSAKLLSGVPMASTSAVISVVAKAPAASSSVPEGWSGTAFRKKPGQPPSTQRKKAALHRQSRSSEDISLPPRTTATFASVPSALPPTKEQSWIWGGDGLCYIDSRGAGPGEERDERYPLPQLTLADDWKERSPGIGPWPLCQQAREGNSSDDHHGGTRESFAAVFDGARSRDDGRANDNNSSDADATTRATASAAVDSPTRDSRLTFGNISAEQSARLRALREDTEHGQSTAVRGASAAAASLGSRGLPSGPE